MCAINLAPCMYPREPRPTANPWRHLRVESKVCGALHALVAQHLRRLDVHLQTLLVDDEPVLQVRMAPTRCEGAGTVASCQAASFDRHLIVRVGWPGPPLPSLPAHLCRTVGHGHAKQGGLLRAVARGRLRCCCCICRSWRHCCCRRLSLLPAAGVGAGSRRGKHTRCATGAATRPGRRPAGLRNCRRQHWSGDPLDALRSYVRKVSTRLRLRAEPMCLAPGGPGVHERRKVWKHCSRLLLPATIAHFPFHDHPCTANDNGQRHRPRKGLPPCFRSAWPAWGPCAGRLRSDAAGQHHQGLSRDAGAAGGQLHCWQRR